MTDAELSQEFIEALGQGEKPIEELTKQMNRKIINFTVTETINHIKEKGGLE